MSSQFVRKCSLIVYEQTAIGSPQPSQTTTSTTGQPGNPIEVSGSPAPAAPGIDLSQFRIQFKTTAQDVDSPPTATMRVFNLAESTVQLIQNEFQNVTLQAGYESGNFGVIFQGSIVRIRRGRLSNIDTFVDIMASNFDAVYNYGLVSKSVAKGSTLKDQLNVIQQGVKDSPAAKVSAPGSNALAAGYQYGSIPDSFSTGGTLPRGKVLFGLARDHLTDVANTGNATWSVGPDGKVNIKPLNGYLTGEAVVLTSQTGMLGVPEATQQGIEVKALLNPFVKIGTRIQLDNASINTTTNQQAIGFPSYTDLAFFASTSDDGFYTSYVVEHEGDTRGAGPESWVTKITALAVDQSSGTVQPYGGAGVT